MYRSAEISMVMRGKPAITQVFAFFAFFFFFAMMVTFCAGQC
jgi:hypothetical protein